MHFIFLRFCADLLLQNIHLIFYSISAVASQALPANTFTSTYKNYRFIWRHTQNTSTGALTIRLRASGSDASGANYIIGGNYSGISSGVTRINASGITNWTSYSPTATSVVTIIGDLIYPQQAERTIGTLLMWSSASGDINSVGVEHTLSTAYDSLNFITGAGTMTGQVSVYGYNE